MNQQIINKRCPSFNDCIIITNKQMNNKNQNEKSIPKNQQQYYEPDITKRASFVTNEDYFSLLCRNGPLPEKYHKQTDLLCVGMYLIMVGVMIVGVIANGLSGERFTYEKEDDLMKDLLYGQRFFLWEMIFAGCGLVALSMFMTILALFVPKIMSFFSIIMMIVLCGLFTFLQIRRFLQQQQTIFLYLFKALISIIILVILLAIIIRRRQKIMNLGIFLELSSKVIRPHICLIYTQMVLLSIAQLGIWYGFANLYYGVATVKEISHPVVNSLTKLIVVIVWLWTSGALIALSDYVVISYAVHWFYNLSKAEDTTETHQSIERQNLTNEEQLFFMPPTQSKYTPQLFRPIYKKLCSQIGTILFGSILSYLPLYLISKIQKLLFKSTTKELSVVTLSKYGYMDTIMQWQGFMNANNRIYKLRKRIKSVMPQLYMLGHIYGDFTKLSLLLIGLAIIHELVELKSDIAHQGKYWLQYSFTVLFFAIGVGLQIVTNFTNLIGKCGDVVFFLYCIDLEIERVHFARNATYSTPRSLWEILKRLTIKRNWKAQN